MGIIERLKIILEHLFFIQVSRFKFNFRGFNKGISKRCFGVITCDDGSVSRCFFALKLPLAEKSWEWPDPLFAVVAKPSLINRDLIRKFRRSVSEGSAE